MDFSMVASPTWKPPDLPSPWGRMGEFEGDDVDLIALRVDDVGEFVGGEID